jgi:hypothetical protein
MQVALSVFNSEWSAVTLVSNDRQMYVSNAKGTKVPLEPALDLLSSAGAWLYDTCGDPVLGTAALEWQGSVSAADGRAVEYCAVITLLCQLVP